MRIIFIGPPGVGKGTQSQRLCHHLGIPHLSTGEMLRQAIADGTEIGRLSESHLADGRLVPDPIILKLIGDRLAEPDCASGYLLDGFPRTLNQAAALDEFLEARDTRVDGAVALQVDREEIVRRLANRGRNDDRPEVIRERLRAYERQTEPLLEFYNQRGRLYLVDGMGTPDQVFQRIIDVLDSIRRRHALGS